MASNLRGSLHKAVFGSVSLELRASDHLTHSLLPVVARTKFGQLLAKCLVS